MLDRLTSAYARNMINLIRKNGVIQAHPRLHGEYRIDRASDAVSAGSPPLTRGILVFYYFCVDRFRLTPAYAGNICNRRVSWLHLRTHPRIRGEYLPVSGFISGIRGSPPLTQGIYRLRSTELLPKWLAPAYAGNIPVRRCEHRAVEAHPRLRGEYPFGFSKSQTL